MPNFKFVYEFEGTPGAAETAGAKAGWSESWYIVGPADLATAIDQANVQASARRQVLTPGWSLVSCRVSPLDASNNLTRKGTLTYYSPQDAKGVYGAGTAEIDEQPYDAVELSISSVAGHARHFSMRGIGQDVIGASGRFLNPPRWRQKFPAFRDRVIGAVGLGALAIRFRVPGGSNSVIDISIDPATQPLASPQTPVITVPQTDPVFTVGQTLVVTNVLGMTRMNGTWRIKSVGAGIGTNVILQLFPKRRVTVGGKYSASGFVKAYTWQLDNMASMTPAYGTSRRTGRPSNPVRGRRSNRPS